MATITTDLAITAAITPFGVVKFTNVENVLSADATPEQAEYLAAVPGYTVQAAAKPVDKPVDKSADPVDNAKTEQKKKGK